MLLHFQTINIPKFRSLSVLSSKQLYCRFILWLFYYQIVVSHELAKQNFLGFSCSKSKHNSCKFVYLYWNMLICSFGFGLESITARYAFLITSYLSQKQDVFMYKIDSWCYCKTILDWSAVIILQWDIVYIDLYCWLSILLGIYR